MTDQTSEANQGRPSESEDFGGVSASNLAYPSWEFGRTLTWRECLFLWPWRPWVRKQAIGWGYGPVRRSDTVSRNSTGWGGGHQ